MHNQMLHVFRNSPMGRENLLQAAYFCEKQFNLSLCVYVPTSTRFVMGFETGEVMVDLDGSYVAYSGTAHDHVVQLLGQMKPKTRFFEPTEMADTNLPIIPTGWAMMSCPRVISEKSSRIGLGHVGPKVRGIVKHAPFPVFIPCMAYKPWTSVAIFFGGSAVGVNTVKQGIAIARLAQVPFTIYTQLNGTTREECEKTLSKAGVDSYLRSADADWRFFDSGSLEENLYAVRHDSLAVAGAAGHRLMTELIFGSKLEIIQTALPNPLVVVGPNCRTPSGIDVEKPD